MIPSYLGQLAPGAEPSAAPPALRLSQQVIGELRLPSGRIVACDPAVDPDAQPFAAAVPPGTYPVGVTIAHLEGNDERVAAAWVRVADGAPERWEAATLENRPKLRAPAYGVDSGTGGFLSAEAAPLLAAALEQDFGERIADAMDATYTDTRSWAVVPIPGSPDLAVAAFSSGYGDGAYPSYWGFVAGGERICLLTDFELLDGRPAYDGAGLPRPWWKFW